VEAARDLPSNLNVDDVSVLKRVLEPLPEPLVDPIELSFGTLDIPNAVAVRSFRSPGEAQMVRGAADSDDDTEGCLLDSRIFGVPIRKDIVHEVIRYMRAKVRQPQKTKRIWEVSGSKKKPRPQKGQGKSQVGNKRNSAWVGGFKAHGPVLRDFSFNLNRKYRALGLMIALAAKLREGNLHVFDSLSVDSHSTKDLVALLGAHGLLPAVDETSGIIHPGSHTRLLMIEDIEHQLNFERACRNIHYVTPVVGDAVNVLDVVKHSHLVISSAALDGIQERLLRQYGYTGYHGKRQGVLVGLSDMHLTSELGEALSEIEKEEHQ
jgi:large subunit ribosomal protein L4